MGLFSSSLCSLLTGSGKDVPPFGKKTAINVFDKSRLGFFVFFFLILHGFHRPHTMGNSSHNISLMRKMGVFAGKQRDTLPFVTYTLHTTTKAYFFYSYKFKYSVKSMTSFLRRLSEARCSLLVRLELEPSQCAVLTC